MTFLSPQKTQNQFIAGALK